MLKKSMNSADMILIHVNAALILTDIQKKVHRYIPGLCGAFRHGRIRLRRTGCGWSIMDLEAFRVRK